MFCENPSRNLDKHQMYILDIMGPLCLMATTGGSILSISNCRKIKLDDPFPKLVLYTAIADLIFSILVYWAIYNTQPTLCLLNSFGLYFFINCSLSSNAVISVMNYVRTRAQQNTYKVKYLKWLLFLYSLCFLNDIVFHLAADYWSYYAAVSYYEALPLLLTLSICINNLRMIYMLMKEKLTLENKAPLFLSFMAVFVYAQATSTNFLQPSDSILFIIMISLSYLLGILMGFFNYIISNKRIKELMALSNRVSENKRSTIAYSVFKELSTVYNELNTELIQDVEVRKVMNGSAV